MPTSPVTPPDLPPPPPPPPSTSALTIGTTAYDPTGRATIRVAPDRLVHSIDEPGSFEFHEYRGTLPPTYRGGQAIAVTLAGVPVFKGEIASVSTMGGPAGWRFGYLCRDVHAIAQATVPVTNTADGTGQWTFNLPSNDPYFVHAWAGLSVGQILTTLLDGHASALAAAGIAGYIAGDLAGLTLVPPNPVTFQGPSLLNAVRSFLDQWQGNLAMWVDYQSATSDWRLRFADPATFAPFTLTLGTDPVEWPAITRDTSQCYSRVVVRGKANVYAWEGSTYEGTLTPAWTSTGAGNQQSAWTIGAWNTPAGGFDRGSITLLTSTTATIASDFSTESFSTNYWSTNQGTFVAINPAATDITQQETRDITANTAMSAGGSATVTFDAALVNGGYTRYRMYAQPAGSEVDVWRRYRINNSQVAAHLLPMFPQPVGFANGAAIIETSVPVAMLFYPDGTSAPAQFEIDPANGDIRFNEPVVMGCNPPAALAAGGSAVAAPTDVVVLLAYGRGALTATAPSSGYTGTCYSVEGIQRTLYVDVPQWIRAGDQTTYNQYAAMKLATVCNSVVTGNVSYEGLCATGLALGQALNIAGNGFTTGWESLAAPIRSVVVEWPQDGATGFRTSFSLSNRRKQATGDNFYLHPQFTGGASWEGGQMPFGQGFGAQAVGFDTSGGLMQAAGAAGIDPSLGSGSGLPSMPGLAGGMTGLPGMPGLSGFNDLGALGASVHQSGPSMADLTAGFMAGMPGAQPQASPPAPPPPPPAPAAATPAQDRSLSNDDWLAAHAGDIWGGNDG